MRSEAESVKTSVNYHVEGEATASRGALGKRIPLPAIMQWDWDAGDNAFVLFGDTQQGGMGLKFRCEDTACTRLQRLTIIFPSGDATVATGFLFEGSAPWLGSSEVHESGRTTVVDFDWRVDRVGRRWHLGLQRRSDADRDYPRQVDLVITPSAEAPPFATIGLVLEVITSDGDLIVRADLTRA